MELTALLREGDAPDAVVQEAVDLIALKAVTHELGTGQAPPAIRAFIVDEFERASRADDVPPQPRAMATQIADAFFRRTIAR
jgi:hypothetical protein